STCTSHTIPTPCWRFCKGQSKKTNRGRSVKSIGCRHRVPCANFRVPCPRPPTWACFGGRILYRQLHSIEPQQASHLRSPCLPRMSYFTAAYAPKQAFACKISTWRKPVSQASCV